MNLQVRCYILGLLGLILNVPRAFADEPPTTPGTADTAGPPPTPETPPPEVAPVLLAPPIAPFSPPALSPSVAIVPPSSAVAPGLTALKIETGNSSIKFGLLAQPQYEAAGAAVGSGTSQNLYLRRIRVLIGGTLFGDLDYFFDTDSPNLFKAAGDGVKGSSAMVVQDAFATYKIYKDMVKIDAGYMLPSLSHNALQGAGTLYGLDYFANSFLHSNVFDTAVAPVGRDFGVQLRGLLLDGLIEYRVGMFQGKRNAEISAPPATAGGPAGAVENVVGRDVFRIAGRLQVNLLDPENGFFYSGTYLGAKRILSIGGAYDFQYETPSSYKYWTVDGFLDLPVGPGAVTAQANLAQWNGGSLDAAFTKRTAVMAEAGYRIADLKLSPIGRFEKLWVPGTGGAADVTETRFGGGLALWHHGHNSNLKAFYIRVQPTTAGTKDYSLINVQWQVFFF
jgi:hypothetical protein